MSYLVNQKAWRGKAKDLEMLPLIFLIYVIPTHHLRIHAFYANDVYGSFNCNLFLIKKTVPALGALAEFSCVIRK